MRDPSGRRVILATCRLLIGRQRVHQYLKHIHQLERPPSYPNVTAACVTGTANLGR